MSKSDSCLPRHVAIIMDGNGRWARRKGLPRSRGHREGTESIQDIVESCVSMGIPYLTLFGFSTENWSRPKGEITYLFRQLAQFLKRKAGELVERSIRFVPIGRLDEFPKPLREQILETARLSRDGKALTICMALNYGGRAEIVDACRRIASEALAHEISPQDIDEELFAKHLRDIYNILK